MFVENSPKNYYNACKIDQLNHFEVILDATVFPHSTPIHLQTSLSLESSSTTHHHS